MKKLVIFLPVLIVAMFLLSGCGNTSANSNNDDLKTSIVDSDGNNSKYKSECAMPNNPKEIKECMNQN